MKFLIERTSERGMLSEEPPAPGAVRCPDKKAWEIEFSDLEQLVSIIDTLEEPIILSRRKGPGSVVAIEIYDDMREEFL